MQRKKQWLRYRIHHEEHIFDSAITHHEATALAVQYRRELGGQWLIVDANTNTTVSIDGMAPVQQF
jgi:hypothetical protein